MRHAQAIELCHLTCAARASPPEPDISMQPDTVAVTPRHQQRTPASPTQANVAQSTVGCSLRTNCERPSAHDPSPSRSCIRGKAVATR
jgi:hypothetical protein